MYVTFLTSVLMNLLLASRVPSSILRSDEAKNISPEHYADGTHNVEFDHEAFLGKDEKEFHTLTPEQSKQKLGLLVDKIDTNSDGYITEDELAMWIKKVKRDYIASDTKRVWSYYDKSPRENISWPEYQEITYGKLDEDHFADKDELEMQKADAKKDERRFKMADTDNDEVLTFFEFVDFLHPEDAASMADSVVLDTIDELDKDGDGFISLEEYLDAEVGTAVELQSERATKEIDGFNQWRDLNQDGKLDLNEVHSWLYPDNYEGALAESKHLIYQTDTDSDNQLSKEEIINNYQLFVGSQATSYGDALHHDEF